MVEIDSGTSVTYEKTFDGLVFFSIGKKMYCIDEDIWNRSTKQIP